MVLAVLSALLAVDAAAGPAVRAADYRDAMLADNPVAYWRLGETSGGIAFDELGTLDASYEDSPTLGQPSLVADSDLATSAET